MTEQPNSFLIRNHHPFPQAYHDWVSLAIVGKVFVHELYLFMIHEHFLLLNY